MQIIQTQSSPSGSGHVIQGPQKDHHKETRGPGTRDDLVAELITQPSSQDSAINYDINFSVAIQLLDWFPSWPLAAGHALKQERD